MEQTGKRKKRWAIHCSCREPTEKRRKVNMKPKIPLHTHTHTKKKNKMGAECSIVRMVGLKEGMRRIGRPLDGWLKKCTVRNKEVNGSGG
jgi:hypothetical protein